MRKNAVVDAGSGAEDNSDALAEFDVDAMTGAKTVGLHPGDTSLDANTAVPADARARIAAHLASVLACNLLQALIISVVQDSGAIEGNSVEAAAAKAAAQDEQQTSCGA